MVDIGRNMQTTTNFDSLICLNDNHITMQGVIDLIDKFEQENVHNVVGNNFSTVHKEAAYNVPPHEQ